MNPKIKFNLILILLFSNLYLYSQKTNSSPSFKWNKNFILTNNSTYTLKFGGRIYNDWAVFYQDDIIDTIYGKLSNSVEFRQIRLFNQGTIFQNINYKLQLDFAKASINIKDIYIEISHIPFIGSFRIGHFKEPFRFEVLSSSKYNTFMERAFPVYFIDERNTGFMFNNLFLNKTISYQLGFFRNADNNASDKNAKNYFNLTSRIATCLLFDNNNNKILHIGIGYTYRKPKDRKYSIAAKPESNMANILASTGDITNIQHINMICPELVFIYKSFCFQTEGISANIYCSEKDYYYNFQSFYTQLSYFITGESKNYKNPLSGFSSVVPEKNFSIGQGYGAWEIALRYSSINLKSHDIYGNKLSDISLGLNWYLNPCTRIMFNYIFSNLRDTGYTKIFQTRFQINF